MSGESWFGEIYLIVMGSFVGLTAYVWLLKNAPISLVATYAYVNPVVAMLIGWAFLSETFSPMIILAGGAIIAAVELIVSAPAPQRAFGRGLLRRSTIAEEIVPLSPARPVRQQRRGPGTDPALGRRSRVPRRRCRHAVHDAGAQALGATWPTSILRSRSPALDRRRGPAHVRDVLGQAQRLAAGLWETDFCRFCVNGSTQGNESLALAVARPGRCGDRRRGIMHKSVFAGLVLAGLEPVWVRPDIDAETGLPLRVPVERVRDALTLRTRRARRLSG